MIIAVDFDGTIVEHDFPYIGNLLPDVKEVLKRLVEEHGHQIIIWTCRSNQNHFKNSDKAKPTLFHVKEFLDDNGVLYHTINENIESLEFQPPRKVYADIYIDDRNLGILPPWKEIYTMITGEDY